MTLRGGTPRTSPVLVLGATGTTGARVAAELRRLGQPVRTASRGQRSSLDPGQVPVVFDWLDSATHGPALVGVGGVYLLAPAGSPAPEQIMVPFIERAAGLGVDRLVLLSASSIERGGPGLGQVHDALARSSSGWAVLRPTWFAQNFVNPTHPLGAAIAAGGDIVTATGSGRVPFVDAQDIARVAVAALLDPTAHNTDHVITGPDALSYNEVARIVSDLTGREVRHRAVSAISAADAMVRAGVPRPVAEMLANMDLRIAAGSENRTTDTVLRITGRPPRALPEVLAESFAPAA